MRTLGLKCQQLIDLGLSEDRATFERRLLAAAHAMGFPIISGALMHRALHPRGFEGASFGNTPDGHAAASADVANALRDPVLDRLTSQPLPVVYDRITYVAAGVGDLWEEQAPHGYKTGIAVKLHPPEHKFFLVGVDREEALPEPGAELMNMVAGVQLIGAHAMTAAERLLTVRQEECPPPTFTKRELDALGWTAQGKTAWEVGIILGMSNKTVNFHLANAMRKLGVNSKHQAVLKCISAGIL